MADMIGQIDGADGRASPITDIPFLGISMAPLELHEALDVVGSMAKGQQFSYVVTPNVDHFVNLYPEISEPRSDLFRAAYDGASLTLCDSRIVRGVPLQRSIDR